MASDASVYSLFNHPNVELLDPFEIQRRKMAISNALAAQQIQQQQIEQGGIALEAAKRDQAAEAAFRAQFMTPQAGAPAAAAPPPASMLPGAPGDGSSAWDPAAAAPALAAPPAAPLPQPGAAPGGAPPQMTRTPAGMAPANIPDSAFYEYFGSKAPGMIKANREAETAIATRQQKLGEVREQDQKYWGSLAGGWEHSGYDPRVIPGLLQLAAGHGLRNTPEFQQFAQLAQNNDIDGMKRLASLAITPEIRKSIAESGAAEELGAGRKQENTQNLIKNAGAFLKTVPNQAAWDGYLSTLKKKDPAAAAAFADIPWSKDAPAIAQQRGMSADQQVTTGLTAAGQAETRRHNKAEEGLGAARLARETEAVQLTPQALDQMATMFATTGNLPNLGMGAAVARTRSAIINRASDMYPNVSFASNSAEFAANKKSYSNVTTTLDTLESFEKAGLKNLKMFTDAAAKIPDTGVPWLNTPVRMLDERLVGSKNMAVVNAARDVALREIARVTNDPKLSGVLSDSARHEVQSLSPKDATLPQILAVANMMQNDMANVHQSLSEQKKAIGDRLGGTPPGMGAPAAPGGSAAPAAAAPLSATGPGGHKIISRDGGNTWQDAQTGARVQ
jgi:hypothetical protein